MVGKYDWRQAEKKLTALLGLSRRPVSVKLLKTAAEYEACDFAEPKSGLPYCTAVANAGRGRAYKLDLKHDRCAASAVALGLKPVEDYRLSGQMHLDLKVYKDLAVSHGVAADMVYCQEQNAGVAVAPLGESSADPDLVLVVANAKAAMRILQGYAYHYGQLKNIKMAGMCAMCQECTSYPLVYDQINVSMLCSGTRCVGRWDENELAVGIPAHFLPEVIDGIWQTVQPMESAKNKELIIKRLKGAGIKEPELDFKHTYYSYSYGRPKPKAE
jgi:uncharacterized protein (DUF169 family)